MPGHPAAELAALDVLRSQRRIFSGDHEAGAEFAFLARRCGRRFYASAYAAALDVLIRSGGRTVVEAVVIHGKMPVSMLEFNRLSDGLDALHEHFKAEGLL
jgi:hypothetical protein